MTQKVVKTVDLSVRGRVCFKSSTGVIPSSGKCRPTPVRSHSMQLWARSLKWVSDCRTYIGNILLTRSNTVCSSVTNWRCNRRVPTWYATVRR